jgi:signal transduction histidine kinase
MVAECLSLEHEVITASSGEAGIELALQTCPDLVICDINMPRMNGFEVLMRFQAIERMADVPFIFLSGLSERSIIRQGMSLGADDYLTKPFVMEELERVVETRLAKRERRQAIVDKAIDALRLNITTALPHELRTAIMIMEGYAQLVLEDAERIDPLQREMVQSICDNAVRLRHMAEKYLWYLRSYLPTQADLHSVTPHVDSVLHEAAYAVADRLNKLELLDLYIEPGQIKISPEFLGKIAEEIIENAFKFSNAGAAIAVQGAVQGEYYVLTVINHGREMTPEQIEQIGGFMQFDRARYEQQGTGLGLIIAKQLIGLIGGTLAITSNHGRTIVTVTLPCLTGDLPLEDDQSSNFWGGVSPFHP